MKSVLVVSEDTEFEPELDQNSTGPVGLAVAWSSDAISFSLSHACRLHGTDKLRNGLLLVRVLRWLDITKRAQSNARHPNSGRIGIATDEPSSRSHARHCRRSRTEEGVHDQFARLGQHLHQLDESVLALLKLVTDST